MPVTTDIANLSQTPALNNPDGATDPPSVLDDQLRYHGSFIAMLRDGAGFSSNAITGALGYTPVQQGTGPSQTSSAVKIGWDGTSRLRVQVDSTDYGNTWPIDIAGNANTATTATTASNATNLGGTAAAEYVKRGTPNVFTISYDTVNGRSVINVDGNAQAVYTTWGNVNGRPSDLASFTNSPGYTTAGATIQRLDTVTGMGRVSGQNALYAQVTGVGNVSWGYTISDERLKLDIADTAADSLEKIDRIRFVGFRFIEGIDSGAPHDVGVIAQEVERIEPRWVLQGDTWKQLDVGEMLLDAMHAIQQLHGLVQAQEARIAALEGRA